MGLLIYKTRFRDMSEDDWRGEEELLDDSFNRDLEISKEH